MSNLYLKLKNQKYHQPIELDVKLNDDVLLQTKATDDFYVIEQQLDDDKKYCLEITIQGKTNHHTLIDSGGEILETAQVSIDTLKVDNTDLLHIYERLDEGITYIHNNNGATNQVSHNFYTTVFGFNGTAKLNFITPKLR